MTYSIPDDAIPDEFSYKSFLLVSNEWARFVVANRCKNNDVRIGVDHNHDARYDIVSGYAADGKRGYLLTLCNDVSERRRSLSLITTSDVFPSNSEKWGTQWSFHTPKSIEYLTLEDIEYYECKEGEQ